jgi:hypothetical protein
VEFDPFRVDSFESNQKFAAVLLLAVIGVYHTQDGWAPFKHPDSLISGESNAWRVSELAAMHIEEIARPWSFPLDSCELGRWPVDCGRTVAAKNVGSTSDPLVLG